jgi:pyruvate/2-oxoglutarate dehydrogenase complex dihydrolipoamide acyltransferase (E2) component
MQVLMPQIGMTMVEGTIESWLKKEGDTVQKGEPILEFSTEKMTNILEAPQAGVLKILAQEGEIITCGEPVAEIN